jgi:predicted acetyltransferase
MRIVTCKELKSKDGLLPLLDHAFNWPFSQNQFEEIISIDPRLKNSPVAFCAIENNRLIGHIGVMDLATRTLDRSIEYVGGIFGVATLPGHTQKGVCTTLMNTAHQHFKEKHYRFSFLSTSPALVAHALYEKLGYTDLTESHRIQSFSREEKQANSKREI